MEGEWLLGHLRRVAILNNCKVRHFVNVSEEYPPIIGATFTRLVARFILGLLVDAHPKLTHGAHARLTHALSRFSRYPSI